MKGVPHSHPNNRSTGDAGAPVLAGFEGCAGDDVHPSNSEVNYPQELESKNSVVPSSYTHTLRKPQRSDPQQLSFVAGLGGVLHLETYHFLIFAQASPSLLRL